MEMSCDIIWFAERDIDVWLAEELRANAGFARWFLSRLGRTTEVSVPAYRTRVSVIDDAGRETDVEGLFHTSDGSTFAVLVEDKIKASFQPNQMNDYVDRGERGKKDGNWSEFAVAVFAPSYRVPFGISLPPSVITLRFEEAANQLKLLDPNDLQSVYRAKFLERAAQPNIISVETENPFLAEWWKAVDEMVRTEFGDFFLIERQRFPKTVYVNPKCANMPSYLRLDLKGSQGKVDLAFKNLSLDVLSSLVSTIKPDNAYVVKYNKSAALQISNLPKFQISDGLDIIQDRVRTSYQAAHKLLSFWRANKKLFDTVYSRSL